MDDHDFDYSGEFFELELIFREERVRGSGEVKCVIIAQDMENEPPQIDTIEAASWDKIVDTYPTLKHVLENMFWSENWRADVSCGPGQRRLAIGKISGHEGLYEYDQVNGVFVDWEDVSKKDVVSIKEPFPEEGLCEKSNLSVSYDDGKTWISAKKITLKFANAIDSDEEQTADLVVGIKEHNDDIDMKLMNPETSDILRQTTLKFFDFVEIVG